MEQLKIKLKIFLTNWVNFLGIFIATYLAIVISDIYNFPQTLFFSLYSILGYGFLFWRGFLIAIFCMDIVLLNKKNIATVLFIEWFTISIPFVYWIFKYGEWIFGVAILAFFITQYFRKEKIIKIFNDPKHQ